jgi:N-acetylmuramoyl-L-alanine amidase
MNATPSEPGPGRRALRTGVLLAALLPLLVGVKRPPGLGDVADVRYWSYADYTRVVIELDRIIGTEVKQLPPDPVNGRPARLYLDLPEVWVGRDYPESILVADGLLQGIRLGQNELRTTRLVLDLEHYERHRLLILTSPPRVVIDVYGSRHRAGGGRPGEPRLPPGIRPVRRVVLDPGHGGRDPGASSRSGLREKDVTLALARVLQPELEKRGFEVFLTRSDDRTLELEERTAFAEGLGSDLFVSLHANAAPRHSLRGIETYYLDRSHSRHTRRVAATENGISPSELDSLQRTVSSLRMSEMSVHSAQLARAVQHELVGGMGRRYRGVEDLGVKKGPFFVLFLSNSPSILVEVGFLSHKDEARRLADADYRRALAVEIADGIALYRDQAAPVVARERR